MSNKITKAAGLTTSNARTRRSAVVAVVADPVTHELDAVALEVPTGSARAVIAWIGDDTARANAASGDTRSTVAAAVARVLGGGDG